MMSEVDMLREAAETVRLWGRMFLNAPGDDAREIASLDMLPLWMEVQASRIEGGEDDDGFAVDFAKAVLSREADPDA